MEVQEQIANMEKQMRENEDSEKKLKESSDSKFHIKT